MLLAFTEGAFLIDRKNKFRRVQSTDEFSRAWLSPG